MKGKRARGKATRARAAKGDTGAAKLLMLIMAAKDAATDVDGAVVFLARSLAEVAIGGARLGDFKVAGVTLLGERYKVHVEHLGKEEKPCPY